VILCGSPDTVIEKLEKLADAVGRWGQTVANQHDSIDDPKPWRNRCAGWRRRFVPRSACPIENPAGMATDGAARRAAAPSPDL